MTETNINLLKQIFWKLQKEEGIVIDIKEAKIYNNNERIAVVDFNNFGIILYKDTEKMSIIPNNSK